MTALGDAIRRFAQERASAVAIDAGEAGCFDWQTLAHRFDQAAREFSAQLALHPRPVATCFDHGIDQCVADIALLEAGAVAIPLPAFFTADQRAHAMRSTGAQMLTAEGGAWCFDSSSFDAALVHEDTAKISFTSGSTGTPKGVSLSAGHMLGVARAVIETVGEAHAGRHLALLPPAILLENVAGFYATLLAGGTYVSMPHAAIGLANPFRPDFARMAEAIAEQRITSLILVPELLAGLVGVMDATGMRFPELTLVAVGGARIAPNLLQRARRLGLPVRQGYGMTECASVIALESAEDAGSGSVGYSLGINRISLATDGEILIDGPICLGEETPFRTGDIGRIDDAGRLWIEGRKSSLIITSHGRNVSPEWVESALVSQPGVAQAMVYGDGSASLGALIVPASLDADIAAAVLAANAVLPEYAQVAYWQPALPYTPANGQLTGNGRIRRSAIADAYLDGDAPFFDRLVARTAAGQYALAATPQLRAGLAGAISRQAYIDYLTQAYHHVSHTVPLMCAARERLLHKPALIAALDAYIAEETGHEAWILADIDAAGGNSRAAAASQPHPATAAMVAHAYDSIRNGNPASFFGMVYVLEGTSIALAANGAAAVQSALGLPPEAFTYLTSHGALDLDHMKFFEALMNRTEDPADQEAIVAMADDMFRLFAGVFASISMEDYDEAA